ncbi:MAG: ABC transporter ATP-binding protein [Pseudomonadota bacterium]
MSNLLEATRLCMTYQKGPTAIEVLKELELTVAEGERVAIVGESGVGKSTLLQVLGAVLVPTGGEIRFDGADLSEKGEKELAEFRNRAVGFVFQFHYLLPEFDALENTLMPLRMRGVSSSEARKKAKVLLEAVGLGHRLDHRPAELSGGEQQRVAIARAMVGEPRMILADEPTGNLDLGTGRSVAEMLFSVAREGRRSLVMATHNLELAAKADRVLRLQNGVLALERIG